MIIRNEDIFSLFFDNYCDFNHFFRKLQAKAMKETPFLYSYSPKNIKYNSMITAILTKCIIVSLIWDRIGGGKKRLGGQ